MGRTIPVLFEEEKGEGPEGLRLWRGHAPNYVEVWCESGEDLHNQVRQVMITAAGEGRLTGTLVRQ